MHCAKIIHAKFVKTTDLQGVTRNSHFTLFKRSKQHLRIRRSLAQEQSLHKVGDRFVSMLRIALTLQFLCHDIVVVRVFVGDGGVVALVGEYWFSFGNSSAANLS